LTNDTSFTRLFWLLCTNTYNPTSSSNNST